MPTREAATDGRGSAANYAGDNLGIPSAAVGRVLDALWQLLNVRWRDAYRDGMAVVIPFGSHEEIVSVDVVPALHRSGGGYHIPDPGAGTWIPTDPEKHAKASTAKNKQCDEKYVPFVKMIKGVNRELGEPVSPSLPA